MKKINGGVIIYQDIREFYKGLSLPVNFFKRGVEFTVHNIGLLHHPLPFFAPANRVNFPVLIFVKNAIGRCMVNDVWFNLRPGTVLFINSGHYRTFEYEMLEDAYIITWSEGFLKENLYAGVMDEYPFLLSKTCAAIKPDGTNLAQFESICHQLFELYRSASMYSEKIISYLFAILLVRLKDHFTMIDNALPESALHSDIVAKFKQHLEQSFRSLAVGDIVQPYHINQFADLLNIHPTHLNAIVKNVTGKTISSWIAEKKIIEAKSILCHSLISVKEIAYKLGFNEPAHFCNYFKRHVHISPALYRKQHTVFNI